MIAINTVAIIAINSYHIGLEGLAAPRCVWSYRVALGAMSGRLGLHQVM